MKRNIYVSNAVPTSATDAVLTSLTRKREVGSHVEAWGIVFSTCLAYLSERGMPNMLKTHLLQFL